MAPSTEAAPPFVLPRTTAVSTFAKAEAVQLAVGVRSRGQSLAHQRGAFLHPCGLKDPPFARFGLTAINASTVTPQPKSILQTSAQDSPPIGCVEGRQRTLALAAGLDAPDLLASYS